MSHTQGKLKAQDSRIYFAGLAGGFDIRDCPAPEDNARRLVACWNALTGIETEYLEQYGLPDFAQKISDLAEQRNELLEELKNIAKANPKNWDAPLNDTASFQQWAQSRARAAIEKVKE